MAREYTVEYTSYEGKKPAPATVLITADDNYHAVAVAEKVLDAKGVGADRIRDIRTTVDSRSIMPW